MARLIQMRQRIKAIETIKKITHAMRLVSMSAHTRMQGKKQFVQQYKTSAADLLKNAYQALPDWTSSILTPEPENKKLIILIGSQKGLCGNFNTRLFSYFESKVLSQLDESVNFIPIGKKATDFLSVNKKIPTLHDFLTFTSLHIPLISAHITNLIINKKAPFSSVVVYSNVLKNFFLQQPRATTLIPFESNQTEEDSYLWEQSKQEIFDSLTYEYLYATIYYLLFESLLAEQATRFIAMDNSTRNADQLLDTMHRMYNKLRQAKITRELTDLMGSFSS